MENWKEVQSTEEPLLYEENNGTVYIRKDVVLTEGDDDTPDMYTYQERKMSASQYPFYEDYERLQADVDYIAMETGVEL